MGGAIPDANPDAILNANAGGGMGGANPDPIPGCMLLIMFGALTTPKGGVVPPMMLGETGLVMPGPII
jgi:hypothetical protein